MVHRGSRWVSVLSTSSARRSGRSQHNTKRISVLPRCITWDFRSAPYFYYADMFRIISYKAIGKMLEIARFHMTSRRPYCCSKTIKRRPFWYSKLILWELNCFLLLTLSFVLILEICIDAGHVSENAIVWDCRMAEINWGMVLCRNLTQYFAFLKKKCIVSWL